MSQITILTNNMIKWKEGKELVLNKEYQKAIRVYQTALKKEGGHAFIYFEIGECYYLLEKYKKANEFFEKGIAVLDDEKAVELAHYFYVYSTLLVELGNIDRAYEYSKKSVLIARNVNNLANHSKICFSLEWLDKAVPTLAYCELKAPQDKEVRKLITKYRQGINKFWGTSEADEKKIRYVLGDFPDGNRLSPWIIDGSVVQQNLYFPHWGDLAEALLCAQFEISSIFLKRMCTLAFASSQVGSLFDFFSRHFKQDFSSFLNLLDEWKLELPVQQLQESYSPVTLKWLHQLVLYWVEKKQYAKAFDWASKLVAISPLSVDGYIAQAEVLTHQKKKEDAIQSLVKAGMINKRKISHLKWIEPLKKDVNQRVSDYWKCHDKKMVITEIVDIIGEKYGYSDEEKKEIENFLTATRMPTNCPVFYHWNKIALALVEKFFQFDDTILLRIYWGAFEQGEHYSIFQFLWNNYAEDPNQYLDLLSKTKIELTKLVECFLDTFHYQEKSYEQLVSFLVPTYEKPILAHYAQNENHSVWTKLLTKMGTNGIKTIKKVLNASAVEWNKMEIHFNYEHALVNYLEEETFTEQLIAKRVQIWLDGVIQHKKMKNGLANQVEKFLLKGKKEEGFDEHLQAFAQKFNYATDFYTLFLQDVDYNEDSPFYTRLLALMAFLDLESFLVEINESVDYVEIADFLNTQNLPLELFVVYALQANEKMYFEQLAIEQLEATKNAIKWVPSKAKVQAIEWLWIQYQEELIPWLLEEGTNLGVQVRQKIMEVLEGNIYAYQYTQTLLASKKQGVREVGISVLMSLQKSIFEQLKIHYETERSEDLSQTLENHFEKHQIKAFKETSEEKEVRFDKIGQILRAVIDKDIQNF